MKKIVFSLGMLIITSAVFSQNCFTFSRLPFFSPASNGSSSLTIDFNNDGSKALNVIVKCGSTVILDTCFIGFKTGQSIITGLSCPGGIGSLSASFIQRTGNCSSRACDSIRIDPIGTGPLPVKLSSFSAVRSKKVVSLNWNTELEIDSKEFIVERAEGTEFRSVGTISSNGNSNSKKSYSFNDKNENAANTYYRLKNVDLNGKFTYSEIRTIKGIGDVNDVTVFPNPARLNSKISVVGVTANSSIQLLDFSGKVLKTLNNNTINSIDLSGVKNGTYLIRIIDKSTNEIVNKKLTVSN